MSQDYQALLRKEWIPFRRCNIQIFENVEEFLEKAVYDNTTMP